MSSPAPNAKPPPVTIFTKPLDILPTQIAHLYSNLHPILLLSVLYFSFKGLVADPVNALISVCPTLTLLQAIYCVLCLPSTGQTASSSTPRPGQKRKASKAGQDAWAQVVPVFLSLLLTFTLTAPVLYITLILFGAPLTTHLAHTMLLAVHLALFTTPQLFYAHGLVKETWFKIVSLQIPVDEAFGMALGACLGSWVGAIPIPLDWDREWQKWPVTIVTGMYLGAVVGKFAGGYVFKGWRIKIS